MKVRPEPMMRGVFSTSEPSTTPSCVMMPRVHLGNRLDHARAANAVDADAGDRLGEAQAHSTRDPNRSP